MAKRIFYVEDEIFLSKIIKESLEQKGYEVCLVRDGRFAAAALLDFEPDICVLDVMLPNVDGFEIAQLIKNQYPQVPILFLTAKDQTEDVLKGFRLGANDYIRKPCSLEELLARIQNLLQLTANSQVVDAGSKEAINLGAFTFFPHKYQLQHQEETPKALSHKETELLKLFAQHINQTVERQALLKTVWGDDSFFNSRTLDVYVTKLRGYLKQDSRIRIITLRGVGYHFLIEGHKSGA